MKIEIPQPCPAKFENFDKTAEGGFCQQCSTEVIDFTTKTDQEIFDFFLKSKGKVCGRLPSKAMSFKTVAPQLPKRGLAAASMSLLALSTTLDSNAQNDRIVTQGEVVASFTHETTQAHYENAVSGRLLIRGSYLPIKGGKISYGDYTVHSDNNGVFLLPLPTSVRSLDKIEIQFQHQEMSTVIKTIHQPKGQMKLGDVHLEAREQTEYVVKGRLLCERTKEPLIYVTIVLSNTQIGTITDFDGLFELRVKKEMIPDCPKLGFHYVGYENQFLELEASNSSLDLGDILMTESTNLGMVIGTISISRRERIKHRLKRFFGFGVKRQDH